MPLWFTIEVTGLWLSAQFRPLHSPCAKMPPPLLASCARHSAARCDIAVDRPIVSPLTEWICSQSFVEGFPG